MDRRSLSLNAGPAALLPAFLYYMGGGAALTAFFTAALAHELGHLLALTASGARVLGARFTWAGPVLEYGGGLSPGQEAGIAAAGPLGGLVFAWGCFLADTPYFRYAGLVAMFGTAFNLLPVYPADGGRLAKLLLEAAMPERTADRVLRAVGSVTSLGVAALGLWWKAPPLGLAGLFLLANTLGLG